MRFKLNTRKPLLLIAGGAETINPFPFQQRAEKAPHYELKKFEKFLDDHPAIAADLERAPSLIANQSYLAGRPELRQFLQTHPELAQEVLAKSGQCSQSIPAIFDRVSPAVVFIYATSINPYRTTDRVEHVVGSGFIFDASGLVLTNSHVAFGRQTLIVALEDGTSLPAQLVGADPIFDIAVLRIPKPEKGTLPVVALGDSDRLHVGEEMLAIGNPLGAGAAVNLTVFREGKYLEVKYTLPERPLLPGDLTSQSVAAPLAGRNAAKMLDRGSSFRF